MKNSVCETITRIKLFLCLASRYIRITGRFFSFSVCYTEKMVRSQIGVVG